MSACASVDNSLIGTIQKRVDQLGDVERKKVFTECENMVDKDSLKVLNCLLTGLGVTNISSADKDNIAKCFDCIQSMNCTNDDLNTLNKIHKAIKSGDRRDMDWWWWLVIAGGAVLLMVVIMVVIMMMTKNRNPSSRSRSRSMSSSSSR
jgi:hypothetical protein